MSDPMNQGRSQYSVTVHISPRFTTRTIIEPDGNIIQVPSKPGHMFYSLSDGTNQYSFGFAPERDKGIIDGWFAQGHIYRDDNQVYDPSVTQTFTLDITADQFLRMKDYGENPEKYGFDVNNYNGATNSCVDHTFHALKVGNLKISGDQYPREGTEGRIYPHNNSGAIRRLINPELDGRYWCAKEDWTPTGSHYNFECVDNWCKLNRSGQTRTYYDPLALDLDGDGLETVGTQRLSGSLFDHNRDGIRTATGWVAADDGFLVYDRNGNGMIDNGGELFGDNTLLADGSRAAHGYAALAELDTDGNGKIDAADQAFSSLRVWRDLNQDGISQSGELFALADVGVQALNLAHTTPNTNLGNGNFLAQSGSYTKTDGSTAQMGDLDLAADHLFSRHSEVVELTDEQRQAPNLQGMGRLRDLREAAALSGSLSAVLAAYVEVVNDAIWEWGFKVA